jgi:tetratricopeptide (TPR) repeat protein
MGIAHRNLGQLDEARACYERALAIDEHSLGADSLPVSEVLLNLANVLTDRKQYAEASVALQRALRIDEDKLGPQHESVATALLSIANVLRRQQDNAGALDKLRRAASIFEATGQSGRTVYANVLLTICSMEVQLERPRDATSPCTRGLAVMERVNGPDSPAVADVLVDPVSSAYAANGMARQALAALERGIAGLPRGNPRVQLRIAVGEIRLAQTLWRYAPAARAQARVLAVRSLEWFREAGADLEAERKEIERWLASRGGVPRRAARVGGAGP